MDLAIDIFRLYLIGCAINALLVLAAAFFVRKIVPEVEYSKVEFVTISTACLLSWFFTFVSVYSTTFVYLINKSNRKEIINDEYWEDEDDI